MPGDEKMMGDYTLAELNNMTTGEYADASVRQFRKPLVASPGAQAEERPAYAGVSVGSPFPAIVTQAVPGVSDAPGENVWGRKRNMGDDFICPSGQKCQLRPLQLEVLLMEGILDQVTRLDGLAQALVNQAQGLPPEKITMPSREDFATLLTLVNKLTVMAVAQPRVFPADYADPIPEGAVTVDMIDITDRIAIMEESLKGIKGLDNFRHPG